MGYIMVLTRGCMRSGKTSVISQSIDENRMFKRSRLPTFLLTTVTTLTTVFSRIVRKFQNLFLCGKILSLPSLVSLIINRKEKKKEK